MRLVSSDRGERTILRRFRPRLATLLAVSLPGIGLAVTHWGCIAGSGGPIGITPGGAQDIASARSIIESGGVPEPAAITVEGFLSEHAIPITPPADPGLVYIAASTAWNRDFDTFTPLVTVRIGFGTTIDRETFHRSDLNLGLVIDGSGSMDEFVDQRSATTKLDAVKIAVDRLLAQLTAKDRVSIVTFDSDAQTLLEAATGSDIAAIKTALDEVNADGGTDLAAGLQRGLEVVARNSAGTRLDRVIVFTDAQLNRRNETRVQRFLEVMRDYANDNIGTTVLGVGTEFGDEVANDISQVRGGNYFFLNDYDRITTVFDQEFDYLVTPAAYDITISVNVPFEFDVAGVYGLPTTEPLGHALRLTIPTLFLSSREGGGSVFVRTRAGALVDFSEAQPAATVKLAYTTVDGDRITEPTIIAALPPNLDPSGEVSFFQSQATKRGVLLLNTALTLRNACDDVYVGEYYRYYDYEGRSRAITRLEEFLDYFDALAAGMEDQVAPESRSLSQERALVAKLLDNLR